ncbi:MAG: HAD-IA family hydrolase, partial [Rhodospirillaceae bacterium]|nr:HAD-IA family hydrolase [Rhodospirillaceae bacterium]
MTSITENIFTPPTKPHAKPVAKPVAIIFDWDNTLVDSWVVIHDALNATLNDYGMENWSLDETKSRVAHSMRDSFPTLFGDEWERAGEVFYGHFKKTHLERLSPLPESAGVLSELSKMGIYLGIVSNKTGELLRLEVSHLGWDAMFDVIVGAGDAAHDKPAVDPVEMALLGSNIAMGPHVWFVGDAKIDMECAINAGCLAVLIHETPPNDVEFGPFMP